MDEFHPENVWSVTPSSVYYSNKTKPKPLDGEDRERVIQRNIEKSYEDRKKDGYGPVWINDFLKQLDFYNPEDLEPTYRSETQKWVSKLEASLCDFDKAYLTKQDVVDALKTVAG